MVRKLTLVLLCALFIVPLARAEDEFWFPFLYIHVLTADSIRARAFSVDEFSAGVTHTAYSSTDSLVVASLSVLDSTVGFKFADFQGVQRIAFIDSLNCRVIFVSDTANLADVLRVSGDLNRVGINHAAPEHALHIVGAVYSEGDGSSVSYYLASDKAIRGAGAVYMDYGNGGAGDLHFRGGAGLNATMNMTNAGLVGVGTSAPVANSMTLGSKNVQRDLIVTREAVPAGTDSCAKLTVLNGKGTAIGDSIKFDIFVYSPTRDSVYTIRLKVDGVATLDEVNMNGGQLYNQVCYPPPWSVALDAPAGLADTTWFRPIEFYGAAGITLDSIRVEATSDNQDINLIKRGRNGGSIGIVDAIVAATDGIGEVYYQTETTLTLSTLANGERLGLTKPTVASASVLIIVFYHYTTQKF